MNSSRESFEVEGETYTTQLEEDGTYSVYDFMGSRIGRLIGSSGNYRIEQWDGVYGVWKFVANRIGKPTSVGTLVRSL